MATKKTVQEVANKTRSIGTIIVEQPEMVQLPVRIVGTSPIIPKSFGGGALDALAALQAVKKTGRAEKQARTKTMIKSEIADCFYYTDDGLVSVPAVNIKMAMADGLKFYNDKLFKTQLQRMFMVNGVNGKYWDQIPLEFKATDQVNRCDIIRLPNRMPDFRFRPSFKNWALTFVVSFYPTHISAESIINAVKWAGVSCGLLEWRPQKGGDFGMFKIDTKAMSSAKSAEKLLKKKYKKIKPHFNLPKNIPAPFAKAA